MLVYSSRLVSANGRAKELPDVVIYNDGTRMRGNYVIEFHDKNGKVYRHGFVKDFPRLELMGTPVTRFKRHRGALCPRN